MTPGSAPAHLSHAVVLRLHNNSSAAVVKRPQKQIKSKKTGAHMGCFHYISKSIRNLSRHFFLNLRALADVVHDAVELGQPDHLHGVGAAWMGQGCRRLHV
jgi:hypothetical protein